jgi:hypothetical protein
MMCPVTHPGQMMMPLEQRTFAVDYTPAQNFTAQKGELV